MAKIKCPKCNQYEVMKLGKSYLCMNCEARFKEEELNINSSATTKPTQTKTNNTNVKPDYNDTEEASFVGNVL